VCVHDELVGGYYRIASYNCMTEKLSGFATRMGKRSSCKNVKIDRAIFRQQIFP